MTFLRREEKKRDLSRPRYAIKGRKQGPREVPEAQPSFQS